MKGEIRSLIFIALFSQQHFVNKHDALAADTGTIRKYNYQVNLTQALTRDKELMPLLFQRSRRKIKLIIKSLFEVLAKIA
jgi:hypothetical protein